MGREYGYITPKTVLTGGVAVAYEGHVQFCFHMEVPMAKIDEGSLNKGHLRKLNALRKSLGSDIADKAFAEWLAAQPSSKAATPTDVNAQKILVTLEPLVMAGEIKLPRGGYLVRRGRGRVIVERGAE